jgi:predicted ATPase/DNA-binding SARP family transcriptional activator
MLLGVSSRIQMPTEHAMSWLMLSLLGPFQLTLDGKSVKAPMGTKTQALLAYLAAEADRPQRREVLAGLLWPDQPDEAARHSLRQALHQLRQALHQVRPAIGVETPRFLLITAQTIQFNRDGDCSVDVAEFMALFDRCQGHAHRCREACRPCIERLQRAVALYRGHFLAGLFLKDSVPYEEWALVKREQLLRQALSALRSLAQHHASRGQVELLEQVARRQIELDPLAEDGHRQVMRALGWNGQRNAALAHYEMLRRMLAGELDALPEQETIELRAQLEAGALPLPTSPLLRNWPAYVQLTSFVGRQGELARIAAHLQSAQTRLLTLLGPGGVGKTRLALQAAEREAYGFRDGACWVQLDTVDAPELVLPAIATALGLAFSGPANPAAQLCDWLHEKEMLLVLDNCERCVEMAPFMGDLVATCPQTRFLATSRQPLHVRGEQRFAVSPLPLPELPHPSGGSSGLGELSSSPAVALFVDRARAVRSSFALTAKNAAAVAQICAHLDGLPLLIELAAAHIRSLSPQAILLRLASRLTLLAHGPRDLPPRQRTLRNTLDWSYELLDRAERRLFAQLAVFAGGFTPEAAEAICAPDGAAHILAGLESLLDKSLLQLKEMPEGEPRHIMLDTIREYALERQSTHAPQEAAATRKRHAAYYLQLAQMAAPELTGMQQKLWLDRLAREHGNLRAALRWAIDGADALLAAQLCAALWHYWAMRGHLEEGRWWLQRTRALAAVAEDGPSPPTQAMLFNGEGSLAYYQGDEAGARQLFERGLELSRQAGDPWGMAFALDGLGAQAASQGDYDRATTFSQQSLSISRAIGDKWLSGITLLNLGEIARARGNYCQALGCYEEGMALLKEKGDRLFAAIALHDLGQVAQDQGQYGRAQAIHAESLSLCQDLGSQRGIAMCLEKLAAIAGAQGQPGRAARLLGAASALRQTIGAPMNARDRGDYERLAAAVRADLTEDEFTLAWEQGRAMTLEQAIAFALTNQARYS